MANYLTPFNTVSKLVPSFVLFFTGLVTSYAGVVFPAYVESLVITGVGVLLTFLGFFAIMLSMWKVSKHG